MCGCLHTLCHVVQKGFLYIYIYLLKLFVDPQSSDWHGNIFQRMFWVNWTFKRVDALEFLARHVTVLTDCQGKGPAGNSDTPLTTLHVTASMTNQSLGREDESGKEWVGGNKNVKRVQRKDTFTPDWDFLWGSWCLLSSAGIFYSSWLGESVSNLPVRHSCVCFCRCGKSCHQIMAGRPQILLLLEEKLGKFFFFRIYLSYHLLPYIFKTVHFFHVALWP